MNGSMHTHGMKFNRADGEELIDTKVGGVHLKDNLLQSSQIYAASV